MCLGSHAAHRAGLEDIAHAAFQPLGFDGSLIDLQVFLPEAFAEQWEWTTESFEPISSREGRILSADGTVLAYDTVHFGIWIHYRWLEEPANPLWLRRKALALLDRKDRRDREK